MVFASVNKKATWLHGLHIYNYTAKVLKWTYFLTEWLFWKHILSKSKNGVKRSVDVPDSDDFSGWLGWRCQLYSLCLLTHTTNDFWTFFRFCQRLFNLQFERQLAESAFGTWLNGFDYQRNLALCNLTAVVQDKQKPSQPLARTLFFLFSYLSEMILSHSLSEMAAISRNITGFLWLYLPQRKPFGCITKPLNS